jgi:pimeloyl-ACP methyl ester carboxylesterase
MNDASLRTANQMIGSLFPAAVAEWARRRAMRPQRGRDRPDPPEAETLTFRFGLSGLRWGTAGPRVLALHGWQGRASQFRMLAAALVPAGFQLIALDGPAHGRSPGREANPSMMADALLEAAVETGPLHAVIGHSMGGAAALYAAAQGLPADRAVVLGAPAAVSDVLRRISRGLGLPARAERLFYGAMERRNGVPNELLDIERLAGSLRQPVLVVHDREDRAVPFADGQRIADATGGLMLATTGLGHSGILRDPMVAQRIRRYLGD